MQRSEIAKRKPVEDIPQIEFFQAIHKLWYNYLDLTHFEKDTHTIIFT